LDSSGPDPEQAAALDATLFLRDPFQVINEGNFFTQPNDRNTRVILFGSNLSLDPNEPPSTIKVHLIDANGLTFEVAVEDARHLPNFPFTQVVFRLPDGIAAGRCLVSIELHNQTSNIGTFRIRS
jgi:hypothetical protein